MTPQNWLDVSSKRQSSKIIRYFYQFIGFLLGARIFMTLLLTFALYVSTFFLFNQVESLKAFVFDFKIHGIIFCTVLTVSAGGIINQFYDKEKDKLIKPFRTRIQSFLRQKYFLYSYLFLNCVSLTVAFLISPRVFVFFLVYQFLMWFYSHKLAKILIINNLAFVLLVVYPFFGMLVYYQTFSLKIFLMALFLFNIMLLVDIIKDYLTRKADFIFGYHTLATDFSYQMHTAVTLFLILICSIFSLLLLSNIEITSVMGFYFLSSIGLHAFVAFLLLMKKKKAHFLSLNLLRVWIFVGILAMMADGILMKY